MPLRTYGVLSAIDAQRRALADAVEIFVPLEAARLAIDRTPDVDESSIVAWGRITSEEVAAVLLFEETEEFRAEAQADVDRLFKSDKGWVFTLHFDDAFYKE